MTDANTTDADADAPDATDDERPRSPGPAGGRSAPDRTAPDRFAVPDGESPAACPRCGEPFRRERFRDLHLGVAHAGDLDDAERDRYEDARGTEAEALRLFRLKALLALVLVYFGLLIVYALVA